MIVIMILFVFTFDMTTIIFFILFFIYYLAFLLHQYYQIWIYLCFTKRAPVSTENSMALGAMSIILPNGVYLFYPYCFF